MKSEEKESYLADAGLYVTDYIGDSSSFILVLPPLFEELSRTQKVLVTLSRELASTGRRVVRFDYYGTGLSEGRFEDFSLERARRDFDRMHEYCVREGAEGVHLLGFRFGGFLALSKRGAPRVREIVLWEPLLDLPAYAAQILRQEVANQLVTRSAVRYTQEDLLHVLRTRGTLPLDGYRTSTKLIDELKAEQPLTPSDLTDNTDNLSFLFWENAALHATLCRSGFRSDWMGDVRFSFRHVRFLEPRSEGLFDRTKKSFEACRA